MNHEKPLQVHRLTENYLVEFLEKESQRRTLSMIALLLPSVMLSSLAWLLWEDSRLLKLCSKSSSRSAFLNDWPSTPWRRETQRATQDHSETQHTLSWTMRTVVDACVLLTDKTCRMSPASLLNASCCLYWTNSFMNLTADTMGTLSSPANTVHHITSQRFSNHRTERKKKTLANTHRTNAVLVYCNVIVSIVM